MSNNTDSGYKIFLQLPYTKSTNDEYVFVEAVPFSVNHKIGVSKDGFPLFFVKCDSYSKSIDINLELISVLFSQKCNIKTENYSSNELYTVVILKTLNQDLQRYFTDVFSIILQQLSSIPTEKELYREVRKVIDLFGSVNKPPTKTIQGLWTELLIIERSNDPQYLISSWHVSPLDKYDFNDSIDKVEVKSTSNSERIHRFSIDQLNSNSNSKLIIASTIVVETGIGKSVLNLRDNIASKLNDASSHIRLNEILYKTIGSDYVKLGDIFFDYQLAVDSIFYYNALDIPRILSADIPKEVLNVSFDSNLSSVDPITCTDGVYENSKLFLSLGI